ncbi:putative uncharacterized protein [Aliivibrio wodanis]|uniref:DUF2971 domain-containing protein n=1 Tax=Aliivibrio wodanis TaxID=80852 RepID=A0A090ICP9_9GAMM|nr:putative uncharacterized protein [Aliivibrio wodanis]
MALYHYTDANGLIGILENKTLWVNDVNYMNDTHEIKHGLKVIREEFAKNEDDKSKYTVKFLDMLLSNIYQIGTFLITSFCKSGNILDMWRGYGSSGQKYSIEFDEGLLLTAMKEQYPNADIGFYDCVYGEEETKKLAENICKQWIADEDALTASERGMRVNIPRAIQLIVKPALTMKNYGFENESERRLLALMDNDFIDYNYRSGAYGITPYVKLSFELDNVQSITIGPTQNEYGEMKSIFSILRKLGKERPFPEDFVSVSDITYR